MKLTKSQLKEIIKEEIEKILNKVQLDENEDISELEAQLAALSAERDKSDSNILANKWNKLDKKIQDLKAKQG